MLNIGYHESTSGGFEAMGKEALSVGASTFAFFTRNPRGGKAKEIDDAYIDDAKKIVALMKENNFAPIVAHAPYTMNPCSHDEGLREYALNLIKDDLVHLEYLPGTLYNFHPGSHTGQGSETGIAQTAYFISESLKFMPDTHTTLLIETMAGKGSEIGKNFQEVKQIIDEAEKLYGSSLEGKLGVCLDTCHIWDGGYDIVHNLDGVIQEFDSIIGLKRLKAIHLNDSMNDINSHKDRHEKIGQGHIGLETLSKVTNHPLLKNLPFILETPNQHDGYKNEITLLKENYFG